MEEHEFKKIFEYLPTVAPPPGLHRAVIAIIERKRKRRARTRLALFGALVALTTGVLPFVWGHAAQEVSRSGASHYLSLLFSDSGSVLIYWREFTLTLAESLPVFYASVFLGTLFVLLSSLRIVTKNIHTAFLSTKYSLR